MIAAGEGSGWRLRFAGLSAISLGAFALSTARDAILSGQIRLQHSTIRRAQRPRLYRAAVVLVAAAGGGAVIAGLGLLLEAPSATP